MSRHIDRRKLALGLVHTPTHDTIYVSDHLLSAAFRAQVKPGCRVHMQEILSSIQAKGFEIFITDLEIKEAYIMLSSIYDQQSIQRLLTACSWRTNLNQKENKTKSYLWLPDIPLDRSTNLAVKASQVICAKHSSEIISLPVGSIHWNCRLASKIAACFWMT